MSSEWRNISEESWKKLEHIVEQEMLTPEEIRDNLEVTEKGRIRQSIQNCKYVLEHDSCLREAICRNEMTCQIDIKKKVPWKRPWCSDDGYRYEQPVTVSGKELRAYQ